MAVRKSCEANYLVNVKDMDKAEWLEWRKKGISGSDIGAICGVNRWSSPMKVYLDKLGELPPVEDNDKMLFGRLYEDVIAREFAKRNNVRVERCNFILQNPAVEFAIGNVDRIIYDKERGNGILEVKTASIYAKAEWESAKIPEQYMLQLQWYMFITGLKYGYFAVECGHEYYQHLVERDDELIQLVLSKFVIPFWERVKTKNPPVMDGSEASTDILNNLYPESEKDSEIILEGEDVKELLDTFEQAKIDEKEVKARKDAAANQLKEKLGTNEVGFIDERKITWKTAMVTRVDSKKLKEEKPEIYKQYSNTKSERKFNIA